MRDWIADRLARYFRAVDDRDLPATLALLEGVALSIRGHELPEGEPRRASYASAFAGPHRTAHVLGDLVLDPAGPAAVRYWASYQRYRFVEARPELEAIGAMTGAISTVPSPRWTAHRVVAFDDRASDQDR